MHTRSARALPDDAFFQRAGVRVVEHGRYHLDLRHPAAVAPLDEAIDYLVGELGVGYLKLDYNIRGDQGTDLARESAGAGLLGHNRAYLGWLDRCWTVIPPWSSRTARRAACAPTTPCWPGSRSSPPATSRTSCRYPAIAAAAPGRDDAGTGGHVGVPAAGLQPTTRSPSRYATRCSAASTCPVTSTG